MDCYQPQLRAVGIRSYLKFWPGEIYAVARIYPRTRKTGLIKISVSYYDGRGNKFRKLEQSDDLLKIAGHAECAVAA